MRRSWSMMRVWRYGIGLAVTSVRWSAVKPCGALIVVYSRSTRSPERSALTWASENWLPANDTGMTYITLRFSMPQDGAFLTASGPIFWVLMTEPLMSASGVNLPTTSSIFVAAPACTCSLGTVWMLTIDAAISVRGGISAVAMTTRAVGNWDLICSAAETCV